MSLITILILSAIVGVITAGLSIRFDRFFVMLLLLFLAGFAIKNAVNIFLVVIFLGALTILIENKSNLKNIPKENKVKFLTLVPLLAGSFSLLGSWVFAISSNKVLIITFGILTVLYGLRMAFVHFKEEEKNYTEAKPGIMKLCGLTGPMISGFFVGFIGTSLKSLKVPFGVKFGKMNLQQVYLGNVITATYASFFAIIWRVIFFGLSGASFLIYGIIIWGVVHSISDITAPLFPNSWKKGFQILVGLALLVAAIKVFALI